MPLFHYTQESYLNLSDATFKVDCGEQPNDSYSDVLCCYINLLVISHALKLHVCCAQDLRRKLPVTRTLFPWHNTLAFSLTRDLAKELALGK
jgi:hypothetical protein